MKSFFKNNGLWLAVLFLFLISLSAQVITGYNNFNNEIREYHGKPFTLGEYITSGHCLEATFENWESEFLRMGIFVLLSTFLYQRGSAQSNDADKPYDQNNEMIAKDNSSKPVHRSGWGLWRGQNSLSIVFFALFFLSFILHFAGSLINYNNEQILKGLPVSGSADYFMGSRFWFESFQNWQSEFLSLFFVLMFSVFLRQKDTPQSKPVNVPNN